MRCLWTHYFAVRATDVVRSELEGIKCLQLNRVLIISCSVLWRNKFLHMSKLTWAIHHGHLSPTVADVLLESHYKLNSLGSRPVREDPHRKMVGCWQSVYGLYEAGHLNGITYILCDLCRRTGWADASYGACRSRL